MEWTVYGDRENRRDISYLASHGEQVSLELRWGVVIWTGKGILEVMRTAQLQGGGWKEGD